MSQTPPPPPPPRGIRAIPLATLWVLAVVLLSAAAAATAGWLYFRTPEVVERTLPAPPAPEASAEAIRRAAALRALNQSLQQQIDALRRQVDAPQCPPGTKLDVSALPGGGTAASSATAAPAVTSVTPPAGSPAQPAPSAQASLAPGAHATAKPPSGPPQPALARADLADALDRATALVLSGEGGATGFFVAERLLVTNRHAVEGGDGRLFLASASLGSVRRAEVLRTSPAGGIGAADFALVRMLDGAAPGTLTLAGGVSKLMPVVAAGYPLFSIVNDQGFGRLLAGDASAAPGLVVTTGTVQAIQKTPQGLTAIVHEAAVLQGNSGGPLVDTCGRVVGINTFISVDQKQSARNNYALSAADLAAFLAQAAAPVPLDPRPCAGG